MATGTDLSRAHRTLELGIRGDTVATKFADLTLRLHPHGGGDEEFIEWPTEVGFVSHWCPTWPVLLGQVGFLDHVTVTMSRQSQHVAVEEWNQFDNRFGVPPT